MGERKIKHILLKAANEVKIPDIKKDILSSVDEIDYSIVEVPKKHSKFWYAIPAFLYLFAFVCFGISIVTVISKDGNHEYREIKDMDKVQSVYAYQVTLLTTLLNNPNSVETEHTEIDDALSNSIGFVDLILNLNNTESKLYKGFNKEYDYYLCTKLNEDEFCRFYFNEQSIVNTYSLNTILLQGYIEINDAKFDVLGESILREDGYYTTSFMLGYNHAEVCLSSDEEKQGTYEYRVYNDDVICKTVSLEFKDNEIFMNVDFQNEYFKFQIQGNNNHYRGNYNTGNASGSLMVEIEQDTYNFNVDDNHSSAERYILP